ncbi:hypothetical protein M514_08803 [Trichuris suis]|uniref:Uncharacterized protein n=1 Tax=Trichuris suis TaxID=68888 RepID=A0A085LZA7_9BILA|nr:hypothetical protein M513_08803 [Trichuris suis]KFD69536.1 hypothetical protein M514_08803 [Trichuris suis]
MISDCNRPELLERYCFRLQWYFITSITLLHRFNQHVDALNRYKGAVIKLNGLQQARPDSIDSQRGEETSTTRHKGRGRPPKKKKQTTRSQRNPAKTMADAIKSSAAVQHSSECSLDLIPRIICRENQLSLRKVKEAFYIRHNDTFNRDSGVEISEAWTDLNNRTRCCALAP